MALTTTLVTYKYDKESVVRRSRGSISGTYTASSVNSATAVSTTATGGGIANSRAVDDVLIAAGVITIKLGFVPSRFKILNITTGVGSNEVITQEWLAGMNFGDYLETTTAGIKSLETDNKLEVNVTTGVVTITVDSGIVANSDTVIWFAEG